MGFIQDLARQFGGFIGAQPAGRKMFLVTLVLGSIGAMAYLVIHAQNSSYTVLYQNLSSNDSGEIVRVLKDNNIPFTTEIAGTIKVPASRMTEASAIVSLQGLPNSGTVGYEALDKSTIGQSNFAQQKNYKRMQEGELARTLVKFEGIEQARVHVAVPDESVFATDQQKATISVQLKLRTGYQLTDRQISGITHLVSHSVKGVEDENVVIVDQHGNLLNQNRTDESQNSIGQLQYKLSYEDRLKHEVESLIENQAGRGRVAARVQAEFDYSSLKEERQTYNPDSQDPIPSKEQTTSERSATAATSATLAANTPAKQNTTKEYLVSEVRRATQNTVPQLKRVSVAVLVDGKHAQKNGKDEYLPLTETEIASMTDLVRTTIGFSEERGDAVTVQCSPFTNNELLPLDEKIGWFTPERRHMIEFGVQWGTIGLIGLLLILMVLKPAIKQIVVTQAPAAALTGLNPTRAWIEAAGTGGAQGAPGSLAAIDGGAAAAARMLGNSEQARAFQAQQAAVEQARMSQVQAQQIQHDVIETTRTQPQKTVSLLRQWMDEA